MQAIAVHNRDDLEILYNKNIFKNIFKINDKIITLQLIWVSSLINHSLGLITSKESKKKLILFFINFDTSATSQMKYSAKNLSLHQLQGQDQIIQKIQNSCVRYVTRGRMRDHISPSRFRLAWVSIYNRRLSLALCLIYKL